MMDRQVGHIPVGLAISWLVFLWPRGRSVQRRSMGSAVERGLGTNIAIHVASLLMFVVHSPSSLSPLTLDSL